MPRKKKDQPKYMPLAGLVMTSDNSQLPPGILAGGENMLKRNSMGLIRRPGFDALDVESAAAITIGGSVTNARAAFQLVHGSETIHAVHDGIWTKYDGADSFDQVTKGMTDAKPSVASLAGYGVVATGGRVLKYDGSKPPVPLGAKTIVDMEDDETWTVDGVADTTNETSGAQCISLTGVADTKTTSSASLEDTISGGGFGYFGYVGQSDVAQRIAAGVLNGYEVSKIELWFAPAASLLTQDATLRVQYADGSGLPDGVDIVTETIPKANINATAKFQITISPAAVIADNGKAVCFVIDAHADDSAVSILWRMGGFDPEGTLKRDNDGVGAWTDVTASANDMYHKIWYYDPAGVSIDMYTNYGDTSTVNLHLMADDTSEIVAGANTWVRLKTATSDYFEYRLAQNDFGNGVWAVLAIARGSKSGATDSGFTVTGSPDWSNITSVQYSVALDSTGTTVYLDQVYLLHEYAPPTSNKVKRVHDRLMVADGYTVYYSGKNALDTWYSDAYYNFPATVTGVTEAGPYVLVFTETDVWQGIPLLAFPDYEWRKLSPSGCVGWDCCGEIIYMGFKGAAWVSRNRGVMFWNGEEEPVEISADVAPIFSESGTERFDFTRAAEASMVWNRRWNEMWLFYPAASEATNIKYALVLNADTGEWMPKFTWYGDSNLVSAAMFQDTDGKYKLVLTDSDGTAWKDGDDGRDGYVDGDTPGNAVKSHVETWWFQEEHQVVWHEAHIKMLPATTSSFTINLRHALATIGSSVDLETYPFEENLVYGVGFESTNLDRSVTPTVATDVIDRNITLPADSKGHAVRFKIGPFTSGGTDEWELLGVAVDGRLEGGR